MPPKSLIEQEAQTTGERWKWAFHSHTIIPRWRSFSSPELRVSSPVSALQWRAWTIPHQSKGRGTQSPCSIICLYINFILTVTIAWLALKHTAVFLECISSSVTAALHYKSPGCQMCLICFQHNTREAQGCARASPVARLGCWDMWVCV